ncbi:MAG TPA: hypothetical protein VJX70_03460 [Candidatus Acidoferrum sp.]|nr:hypothetical protein [Candidatus Acidoferrum sp.]
MVNELSARAPKHGAREIIFSLLFVAASGMTGFGLLISWVPATDHTLHLYLFAIAIGLLVLAVPIGYLMGGKAPGTWRPTIATTIAIVIEVLLCIWLGWDSYTHLHHL